MVGRNISLFFGIAAEEWINGGKRRRYAANRKANEQRNVQIEAERREKERNELRAAKQSLRNSIKHLDAVAAEAQKVHIDNHLASIKNSTTSSLFEARQGYYDEVAAIDSFMEWSMTPLFEKRCLGLLNKWSHDMNGCSLEDAIDFKQVAGNESKSALVGYARVLLFEMLVVGLRSNCVTLRKAQLVPKHKRDGLFNNPVIYPYTGDHHTKGYSIFIEYTSVASDFASVMSLGEYSKIFWRCKVEGDDRYRGAIDRFFCNNLFKNAGNYTKPKSLSYLLELNMSLFERALTASFSLSRTHNIKQFKELCAILKQDPITDKRDSAVFFDNNLWPGELCNDFRGNTSYFTRKQLNEDGLMYYVYMANVGKIKTSKEAFSRIVSQIDAERPSTKKLRFNSIMAVNGSVDKEVSLDFNLAAEKCDKSFLAMREF